MLLLRASSQLPAPSSSRCVASSAFFICPFASWNRFHVLFLRLADMIACSFRRFVPFVRSPRSIPPVTPHPAPTTSLNLGSDPDPDTPTPTPTPTPPSTPKLRPQRPDSDVYPNSDAPTPIPSPATRLRPDMRVRLLSACACALAVSPFCVSPFLYFVSPFGYPFRCSI